MTRLQIRTAIRSELQGSTWWSDLEINAAINEGLDAFAFLTLCVEKTSPATITGGQNFYILLSQAGSNWFVPLRAEYAGHKLTPATLEELAAEDPDWRAVADTPKRYAHGGVSLLAFYPMLLTDTVVTLTFAASPARLTVDGDTPEVPEEDHAALVDYGIWRCSLKAGGQDLQQGNERLLRFLEIAKKRAEQVRTRNAAQGYDRLPSEFAQVDISRLRKAMISRVPQRPNDSR